MSGVVKDVPAWLRPPAQGFLTAVQEGQLDAIFRTLLPGDPARHIPGAVSARASRFVSLLLARDDVVYAEIPRWRRLYPAALEALDRYAREAFGTPLSEADASAINAMVTGLERGGLAGLPADMDQKVLFRTLLRHCYQGCFGDPRWGGNADGVMWRALGYLQPPQDGLA